MWAAPDGRSAPQHSAPEERAAAAGEDGTAAGGVAAADGLQEEWSRVNDKFDLVLKAILELEKIDLNSVIPAGARAVVIAK